MKRGTRGRSVSSHMEGRDGGEWVVGTTQVEERLRVDGLRLVKKWAGRVTGRLRGCSAQSMLVGASRWEVQNRAVRTEDVGLRLRKEAGR